MPFSPGTRLGPYEVTAFIAAGGMGEVYRARDTRLGRDVAVKVLPPGLAADPARRHRFEQEARAVAALSHPNILDLHDIGDHEGSPYLVTELLDGETLADRIGLGQLTLTRAVEVGEQIAAGLAAAHDRRIVHRDLKPSNVFLTTDGQVKVLDFGLAKLTRPEPGPFDPTQTLDSSADSGKVVGTVGYMSPEQVRGLPADARSDIFAFGCVLYEMLSGRRAFQGGTSADTLSAILSKDPAPLTDAAEPVPPPLDRVVRRCLEKRPEDRFSSARDVLYALQAAANTPPVPMTPQMRGAELSGFGRRLRALRRPLVALPLLALIVAASVLAAWWLDHRSRLQWARASAIPEILRLAKEGENVQAIILAREVEARLPGERLLSDVWPKIVSDVRWNVVPKGASVSVRGRGTGAGEWVRLGSARGEAVPTPTGYWSFRLEHPGYEPVETAVPDAYIGDRLYELAPAGTLPAGMVRVAAPGNLAEFGLNFFNYERPGSARIEPFLMDRFEVTNIEYKKFVDAGGYRRQEFWKDPVVKDGKVLPWEQAMTLFQDKTGRPGPATWELGSFPEGRGDRPVTGVSWHEAAAYSEFAGKRLPTVYHWDLTSGIFSAGEIIRGANFEGSVAPVGAYRDSLTDWGLYDTAGNAREWCSNATGNLRFTLGGASDGQPYLYVMPEPRSPLDRSATNGFRCMKALTPGSVPPALEQPLRRKPPLSESAAARMDDAVWRTWREFLSYPSSPLAEKVELVRDDPQSPWRMEKVSFAAAYGSVRVVAYLFLPRNVRAPYQVVVYWGAANDWFLRSSDDGRALAVPWAWDYIVRDGRALLYPVLQGTFERRGSYLPDGLGTIDARDRLWANRDLTIMSAKDVLRSIDYLESRSDIDAGRIGLLGFSSGGYYAVLPCAADRRIKACILQAGGAPFPEVLGWARRVRTPVQMVNGRFDAVLPVAEAQAPLFDALATPAADKRHVLFETDHGLSGFLNEMRRVNLEWLDKYLGPVK